MSKLELKTQNICTVLSLSWGLRHFTFFRRTPLEVRISTYGLLWYRFQTLKRYRMAFPSRNGFSFLTRNDSWYRFQTRKRYRMAFLPRNASEYECFSPKPFVFPFLVSFLVFHSFSWYRMAFPSRNVFIPYEECIRGTDSKP